MSHKPTATREEVSAALFNADIPKVQINDILDEIFKCDPTAISADSEPGDDPPPQGNGGH